MKNNSIKTHISYIISILYLIIELIAYQIVLIALWSLILTPLLIGWRITLVVSIAIIFVEGIKICIDTLNLIKEYRKWIRS